MTLTYSSNGWDYEDAECFDPPQMQVVDYNIPIESPHTNAGFGWRIVPGKILTRNEPPFAVPARYVGPDGSERGFYEELHPGYPASPQPSTWFSNDATYLRLRYYTAGSGVCTAAPGGGSGDCHQLEFPDGTVHEFHSFAPGDEEKEWLLTRMTERFEHDHWVSFDYSTAGRWKITDSHQRQHTVFSLRYRYDPANRLVGVDEVTDPSPLEVRPLKEFHYARSNDGPDLRAGKLVMSKRTNWVDPINPLFGAVGSIPIPITQSYRYEGRDGRISARQTRAVIGVGHYAFLTELEWTRQGNLAVLRYPRCLHARCAGDDPPREVDFSYVRGALTSVAGYAPSLSYQLGGMLHQVEHANGVTETIATKPGFPMQRPHQITTSGVAGGNGWSSGPYLYDGAGNVKKIGSQRYQYDRTSRLLAGEVLVGGQEKTQSVSYDAFGNILSLTTGGSVQSTPTSNATNRLTGAGASYDAGGNLTDITLGGETYQYTYDPLNMMKYLQSDTGQARVWISECTLPR